MKTPDYHQLLTRQLHDALGDAPELSAPVRKLLGQVSAVYAQFDEQQASLEATVKLRTEQLMASTSRAYSFLDSLHMGFIMCDINPEVVVINESLRSILAARSDEDGVASSPASWTLGAISQLLEPELELKSLVLKSLKSNQSLEFKEVDFGKRVLRLFIAPMVNEVKGDQQQIGAVILVEDVTEQKILERAKDEFFFIASHELRTPLTAIRGNSRVIAKYYADNMQDKNVLEMVDAIHESSIRLIEIVNDFLDASALEQGKIELHPEPFALAEVAEEVVAELRSVCNAKGVVLTAEPSEPTAPAAMADRQRVKQVVYNLIGNAIKFTDAGAISVHIRTDDKLVRCEVRDTGKGMAAEGQRLLFRKFQQAGSSLLTRDSTRGTGLGLYISKLIVEQSGGQIELVRSEPGKGSVFAFSLPVATRK